MLLSEFRSRLRVMLGNQDLTTQTDESLTEYVNRGYEYLLDRFAHLRGRDWFTFSTVGGVANYDIPSNFSAIMKVYDQGRRCALTPIFPNDVPRWDGVPSARPTVYGHFAAGLTLYPTPDAVYTIGIQAKISNHKLVADSDAPVLEESWDTGILRRARYEYYDEVGDIAKAQYALGSFAEWLSNKPTSIEEEQAVNERGIKVPYGARHPYNTGMESRFRNNAWAHPSYPE